MRSAMNRVCCGSSRAVTSHGRSPPVREVQSALRKPSDALAMTALETARIAGVER
jgi:hypothetical protein